MLTGFLRIILTELMVEGLNVDHGRVLTLLSKDLCPTVNWTNGLGSLVTFLPDCRRRRKKKVLQTRKSHG